MARSLGSYFEDYQNYHRTTGNERCHLLGIPMIVISLLGLLSFLHIGGDSLFGSALFRIDAASIFWLVATLWYLSLSWRLALPFSFVTLAFYFIGRSIPIPALWALFVVGWILQGVGHFVYEKKSPAFLKNIEHLLIGPIWVFARVARYI